MHGFQLPGQAQIRPTGPYMMGSHQPVLVRVSAGHCGMLSTSAGQLHACERVSSARLQKTAQQHAGMLSMLCFCLRRAG
jgi:hypothetical protein